MVYRLEVKLVSGMYEPEEKVSRTFEVSGSCNLEKLCLDILASLDFDFDHMYEFIFSGNRVFDGSPNPGKKSICRNTKLYSLNLKEKEKFRFVYDFGDNWIFDITVKNIIDKPGAETVLVKSVGELEQYPDFDEWDEDYDEDEEWDDDYDEDEEWDDDYDEDDDFDDDFDDEEWDEPLTEMIHYEYTAPDRLFEVAFDYKKTRLWKKLFSSEIFAVKFSDGETGYISVMGNDGQHCALGIYIGQEGLKSLTELIFGELYENIYEELERLMGQDCLQLIFDAKDSLQDSEVEAALTYARKNGIKLSGKNAYPLFSKYQSAHLPWHPENEKDEQYLCEAARAAVFLAGLLKDRSKSDLGLYCLLPDTEDVLCLSVSGEGIEMDERLQLPKISEAAYASPVPGNAVILKKAKGLRSKGTVECRISRSPEPVMQEDGSAPYYPVLLFMVDHTSGKALSPAVFEDFDTDPKAALDNSISNFVEMGMIPKEILVSDDRTERFLDCFKTEFGTEIKRKKSLPKLEEALTDLYDSMLDDGDGDDAEDYEMLLEMVSEIVKMPDNIARTMPKELKNELKNVLGMGILPMELEDKLRKKMGKN